MSSIIGRKRKNKAYRRDQAIFFSFMLIWASAKERGEELKIPAEFAGNREFCEQWNGMKKFFEEQYAAHGMGYIKQRLAEAKARGWLLDPDEFIKEFGGGDS